MTFMTASADLFGALADPTRLRILALLETLELAIGEIASVLDQSQPRISRHVRILVETGLVERRKEGGWVFLRLARTPVGTAVRALFDTLGRAQGEGLAVDADLARLAEVQAERNAVAERYFSSHASEWDRIRTLYAPDAEVEAAMIALMDGKSAGHLLDIGTGTGRMLELFAADALSATALDRSSEMLRIARAKLSEQGTVQRIRAIDFVQGDFYALPLDGESTDTVILHQVLHYAHRPERVIAEVARVLKTGGSVLVADFAPHLREDLRSGSAHARLGFSDDQMRAMFADNGLNVEAQTRITGGELTVCVWRAGKRSTGNRDATRNNRPHRVAA